MNQLILSGLGAYSTGIIIKYSWYYAKNYATTTIYNKSTNMLSKSMNKYIYNDKNYYQKKYGIIYYRVFDNNNDQVIFITSRGFSKKHHTIASNLSEQSNQSKQPNQYEEIENKKEINIIPGYFNIFSSCFEEEDKHPPIIILTHEVDSDKKPEDTFIEILDNLDEHNLEQQLETEQPLEIKSLDTKHLEENNYDEFCLEENESVYDI